MQLGRAFSTSRTHSPPAHPLMRPTVCVIDRAAWGKGIATQALALLLELVSVRPLYARAASDNAGSLRVLQKCGFKAIGTEKSFAAGRNEDIEETVLRLDI